MKDPEIETGGTVESHRTRVRWAHSRPINKCQLNKLTSDHKDSCFQPRWSNRDWIDIPPKTTEMPNKIYDTMALKTLNARQ